MHYVGDPSQAGVDYGVYFDYSKDQQGIQQRLTDTGVRGITEPQMAGYTRADPNRIYFANDVFPNGVLAGKQGSPEYEFGSAVLFHEIGNWIADSLSANRPRQGGPAGDRDAGSNLEQCMYKGWVWKDGRVYQTPR